MSMSEASSVKREPSAPYSPIPNFHNQIRHYKRRSYGSQDPVMEVPYLLSIQVDSYNEFLQKDIPPSERKEIGLESVFRSIFPISGYAGTSATLEYVDYHIGEPTEEVWECRARGLTYGAHLRARMRLIIYDKDNPESNTIRHIREQEVYIGKIPLMTQGNFIINGTDRVVVSQLYRAPGVFFEVDKTKKNVSGKILHKARIIPYRGSWVDFEFDTKNNLFVKIDRNRKLAVTILLRAFGYTTEEMLDVFFEHDICDIKDGSFYLTLVPDRLWGEVAYFDISDDAGNMIVYQGQRVTAQHVQQLKQSMIQSLKVPVDYLTGKVLAKPLFNVETGEILAEANQELTPDILQKLLKTSISRVETIYTNEFNSGGYISTTLRIDPTRTKQEALIEIYRCIRSGEFPTPDTAQNLFNNLFASLDRYDLSAIGRMKLNYRLGRESTVGSGLLSKEDIASVLKILIAIRDGKEKIEEVDHLGNRRVRSVGEMIETQFRLGLVRLERGIKEGLSKAEVEDYMPQDLFNAKPVIAAVKEFFMTNPLCQLKDEVNALGPVTQKRRISALGKGGVPSDRAGAELRDVDATHYARLCPIETPEGANIGLINSLALLSKTDEFGFLVAPYRKVVNGRATQDVQYLSAITEGNYIIAQANTTLDSEGYLQDATVSARYRGDSILTTPDTIDYMDVSPAQIVSVAASLIPFLEHNDANRALMGSNMQRQAVPLLTAEKPLVGTGMESKVAIDSNAVVVAKHGGVVEAVDASRIIIRIHEKETPASQSSVDIYNLVKYGRSNQGTCQNQRPIVRPGDTVKKGDLLADGSSTDIGELALGRNLLVAFMPWHGYNFEDSVILSERVVNQDIFTSIHLEDLLCIARETPFGEEEITADVPNVNVSMLSNLDEAGIVRIGSFVKPGDIVVGKVTPKGEVQLTPEEKLLKAIFGEKASDVKDSSLRVPGGMSGKVIGVSIFTRAGLEKDARAHTIETLMLEQFKKDLDAELGIREEDIYRRMENLLIGAICKDTKRSTSKAVIDKHYLARLAKAQWAEIDVADADLKDQLQAYQDSLVKERDLIQKKYDYKKKSLEQGDELTPGVLKIVKVRLAVSRRIQPGDKIAGRHGNKGVISIVVPVEDMPHMQDGTPVDIILNPLGVPSRMNIGQILETHLGWASKGLGEKIAQLVDQGAPVSDIRQLLEAIYTQGKSSDHPLTAMNDQEIINFAHCLRDGVPVATPVFDGIAEEEIRRLLALADLPLSGQTTLYDGQTGRPFDRSITVGYMYVLKLNHLVDDKMHARSTGSYSLVTQQPLGGRAQFGGQRFGEMEVWALQGYGAAHTLREMLTIKSDDVVGRARAYKNIVDGVQNISPGVPESFNVLMKEMLALGLRVALEPKEPKNVQDADHFDSTDANSTVEETTQ